MLNSLRTMTSISVFLAAFTVSSNAQLRLSDTPPALQLAYDNQARNMAYHAIDGNGAELKRMSIYATRNPAFLWGLSRFYMLRMQMKQLDASGEVPLFDAALAPKLAGLPSSFFSDAVSQRGWGYGLRPIDHDYKRMLHFLREAAELHDPAAEADLSSEYLMESSRYISALRLVPPANIGLTYSERLHYAIYNRAVLDVAKEFCAKGLALVIASIKAGWPGGYTTLLLYVPPDVAYPTTAGESLPPGSFLSTRRMLIRAGCIRRSVPPNASNATSDAALIRAGAQRGSISLIEIELEDTNRRQDRKARAFWESKLRRLAAAGNEKAIHALPILRTLRDYRHRNPSP